MLLALVSVLMTGCETLSDGFTYVKGKVFGPEQEEVAPTFWNGPRIRPGVALIIQIGTPSTAPTTINALVDQNGEVSIPLLLQEPIACDGLTLDAFRKKLVTAYSAYYRQPQITVTFAPVDASGRGGGVSPWGTVTVMGEVASPGPVNIPSTMELTVTKVLQLAGGLKPYANKENIQVSRCDKDGRISKTIVNLKEIGEQGRADKDMVLRGGDVVYVRETWY